MPYQTFFNLPEDKRTRLVDAIMDAFAENDYKNVSVSGIVKAAGVSKGSFYQYFEDKADCYLYLIQMAMEEKIAFMQSIEPADEQLDLFGTLRWMLDVGVRFEFSNPRLSQISYRAVFGDAPLPDETLTMIRDGGLVYFLMMVSQGIESGVIRDDIDPDTAAFLLNTIFSNLGQYLLQRYQVDAETLLDDGALIFDQEQLRTVMNQVIDTLEFGLRKRT